MAGTSRACVPVGTGLGSGRGPELQDHTVQHQSMRAVAGWDGSTVTLTVKPAENWIGLHMVRAAQRWLALVRFSVGCCMEMPLWPCGHAASVSLGPTRHDLGSLARLAMQDTQRIPRSLYVHRSGKLLAVLRQCSELPASEVRLLPAGEVRL